VAKRWRTSLIITVQKIIRVQVRGQLLPAVPFPDVPFQADLLLVRFVARGVRACKRCPTFVPPIVTCRTGLAEHFHGSIKPQLHLRASTLHAFVSTHVGIILLVPVSLFIKILPAAIIPCISPRSFTRIVLVVVAELSAVMTVGVALKEGNEGVKGR
jgi:hypothetical protein